MSPKDFRRQIADMEISRRYEDISAIFCQNIADINGKISNISIISAIYRHNSDIDNADIYHLAIYRSCQFGTERQLWKGQKGLGAEGHLPLLPAEVGVHL